MPDTVQGSLSARLEQSAQGALAMISSRLLKQLAGLLVEVLLVRLLAPEVWEATARFLTFSLATSVTLQFGFPESLLTLGARCEDVRQAKRMLFRVSIVLTLMATAFGLSLLPFSALRLRVLGAESLPILFWFSVLLASELVSGSVPSFLVGQRFVRAAALYGVLGRVPSILGALTAVTLGDGFEDVVCCTAVGSALGALAGLLLSERIAPGTPAQDSSFTFLDQLRYATPVGFTRLAQMANSQLDKLVVLTTLPGAVYGSYYLGAVEVQFVPMLCQTVTSILMPELTRTHDRAAFLAIFHAQVQKLSLVALPTFAFLFVFAERCLVTTYGDGQAAAVASFRVFQLLLLHRFTNYALIFQALSAPRVPLIASLLMLLLNAPLSLVLAQHFGPVGAACATVLSLYLSTIYTFVELRRRLEVPWSRILPFRAYLLTLCAALIATLPTFVLAAYLPCSVPALAVTVLLYLVTYLLLGSAMGVISVGDIRFLSDAARLRFLRTTYGA